MIGLFLAAIAYARPYVVSRHRRALEMACPWRIAKLARHTVRNNFPRRYN